MNTKPWNEVIADLRDSGLTVTEIARRVGLSVQAVSDLGTGHSGEPKGWPAVKLAELHAEITNS